jgi:hypothetical protein
MASAPDRIRMLNDELRQHHQGGLIVLTRGLEALGPELVQTIVDAVSRFDAFTPDNDPYGEHDFGSVEVQGYRVFFKIDYYNPDLSDYSRDPADPTVTRRVMTLMLAEEY